MGGAGAGPDIDDLFASMFGMNMGGGMPGGPGGRPRGPMKGENEEQQYNVSLEDLYKGRTVKFSSTKNVICAQCKGKGGKEKATPKDCSSCGGMGKDDTYTYLIYLAKGWIIGLIYLNVQVERKN